MFYLQECKERLAGKQLGKPLNNRSWINAEQEVNNYFKHVCALTPL